MMVPTEVLAKQHAEGITRLLINFHSYVQKESDAGLKDLAGLKNLTVLNLALTRVTDTGLKELAGLQQLETLALPSAYIAK